MNTREKDKSKRLPNTSDAMVVDEVIKDAK